MTESEMGIGPRGIVVYHTELAELSHLQLTIHIAHLAIYESGLKYDTEKNCANDELKRFEAELESRADYVPFNLQAAIKRTEERLEGVFAPVERTRRKAG